MLKLKIRINKSVDKEQKLAQTASYLARHRRINRPQTPPGFRSRSSVGYYGVYSHNN